MNNIENAELLRGCGDYVNKLKTVIDTVIMQLRRLQYDLNVDKLGNVIILSLEAFSLLDTAEQYEQFIYRFHNRIHDKHHTLAKISDVMSHVSNSVQVDVKKTADNNDSINRNIDQNNPAESLVQTAVDVFDLSSIEPTFSGSVANFY